VGGWVAGVTSVGNMRVAVACCNQPWLPYTLRLLNATLDILHHDNTTMLNVMFRDADGLPSHISSHLEQITCQVINVTCVRTSAQLVVICQPGDSGGPLIHSRLTGPVHVCITTTWQSIPEVRNTYERHTY
jgi:hypothetical protein